MTTDGWNAATDPDEPWVRRDRDEGSAPPAGGSAFVHEIEPGVSPSTSVVVAVAAVTGTPTESMEALYDAVDPDALDRLVEPSGPESGPVSVTFEYGGAVVTVDSSRRVLISG